MEPSWDGGTKACSNGPGHIKPLKIFFSGIERPMTLKLGILH